MANDDQPIVSPGGSVPTANGETQPKTQETQEAGISDASLTQQPNSVGAGPSNGATSTNTQVPQWLRNAGVGSWSLVGVVLVIAGVVFATSRISAVFIAVFVAFVFTALLNPAVNFLAKYMPRGFAVLVALLSAIAVFAGLITFVVTSVAGQWDKLYDQLANGLEKIVDFLNGLPFKFQFTTEGILKWFQDRKLAAARYYSDVECRGNRDFLYHCRACCVRDRFLPVTGIRYVALVPQYASSNQTR